MTIPDEELRRLSEEAKVLLGTHLAAEGLTGQLLNRQAAKVYDAAVNAVRTRLNSAPAAPVDAEGPTTFRHWIKRDPLVIAGGKGGNVVVPFADDDEMLAIIKSLGDRPMSDSNPERNYDYPGSEIGQRREELSAAGRHILASLPPTGAEGLVEQGDREAAAAYLCKCGDHEFAAGCRAGGENDKTLLVQAFARHRAQSIAALTEEVGRLREAMTKAEPALDGMLQTWLDYHDAHSLTEPVTGRSAGAFDKALEARDLCTAALAQQGVK